MPMAQEFSDIQMADAQALTASFEVANSTSVIDIRKVSQMTFYRTYTPGATETSNTMEMVIEFSNDVDAPTNANATWHQEGFVEASTPNTTFIDRKLQFQTDATDAPNTYVAAPLRSQGDAAFMRIRLKETGVAANAGTASVKVILRYV